jgi:predicted MFS family arabinose efflux permease
VLANLMFALPAAAAVAVFGSMSLTVQQATLQRVIPGPVLARVTAVFLAGQAAATLVGSVAGPFLAQAAGLVTVAIAASLVNLSAVALAFLTMPGGRADIPFFHALPRRFAGLKYRSTWCYAAYARVGRRILIRLLTSAMPRLNVMTFLGEGGSHDSTAGRKLPA